MQGKLRPITFVLIVLVMTATMAAAPPASADTKFIYVATTGNDSTGNGSFDNPYATIDKARQVIRAAHPLQHPYEVRIRQGTYYLTSTLTFTTLDSGTSTCPISYVAYNGENVVISGGKPINLTWYPQNMNPTTLYACVVSGTIDNYKTRNIKHLWKDGVRQTLARYPNVGVGTPAGYMLTTTASQSTTQATLPQINVHDNWTGGELLIFGPDNSDWVANLVSISSINGSTVTFGQDVMYSRSKGRRCYVRNIFGEMDSAGEWFLGTVDGHFSDGLLYVYSTSAPSGQYVTGYLNRLIVMDDASPYWQPISYINFRGLTFTQTTGVQYGDCWSPNFHAVLLRNVDHCKIEGCEFVDLAGGAIGIDPFSEYVTVKDCHISYIDGNGIEFLGEGPCIPNTPDYVNYDLVSGNEIHHIGELYKGASGISAMYVNYNTYENNYFHDLPARAFGISTKNGYNTYQNNEMRNTVQESADEGAFHTWPYDIDDPQEQGNLVTKNLVVNAKGYYYCAGSPSCWLGHANPTLHNDWGYAYYIDNSSRGYSLRSNVARDCFGGLIFHGTYDCPNVDNNFWINNYRQSSFWNTIIMQAPELMGWFNIHHNISYANSAYTQNEIFGGGNAEWLTGHGVTINNNVYYANGGGVRIPSRVGALSSFSGTGLASWSQWRSTYEFDATYSTADPQFTNISVDDYRMNGLLGISSIDFSVAFTAHPASKVVAPNQRVTFSVSVTGLAPRYQWYFRPTGGSWGAIGGATQSSYTIDSVKRANIGDYYVVVTNCRGSWGSNAATLKLKVPGDVNGDGITDIVEFNQANGAWNARGFGAIYTWGAGGDFALTGDYNADGKLCAGVCRPNGGGTASADWYLDYSGTPAGGDLGVTFGPGVGIPVTGDFDGDNDTDFGYFDSSNGQWHIYGMSNPIATWGADGDIPIPADYDGDNKTDVAVYRPNTGSNNGEFWIVYSGGGSLHVSSFGSATSIPVYGDYNGDGYAEFGYSDGKNFTIYGIAGSVALNSSVGDIPLMGDYDGDGITDYAAYHPAGGGSTWYMRWSSDPAGNHDVNPYGSSGRTPVPAAITGWNGIITSHPTGIDTKVGYSASFSVIAQGSGLTYQWYKGANQLSNGGRISGATSSTLTITSLVTGDSGDYKCVVTNWNSIPRTSRLATLTVTN